jgi:16S rRNA (cytosine1402-N4)-methyltransferase
MIDTTLGEGGHTMAFLSRFPDLSVIGIDADSSVQDVAKQRLAGFGNRVQFHLGRSQEFLANYPAGQKRPDTILADCGISMFHYEKSGRGFSFRKDEPLDMRIDTSQGPTAADILARMSETEIADMIYKNSDERYSRRIARAIVGERRHGTISTTAALTELVVRAVPAGYRHGPVHPATRTFQALRIAVNGELSGLSELLESALKILEPGGRIGIISFHSSEDRVVKFFFKLKNELNILTRKGVTAGEEEIKRNPPSRSARLRVAEKIKEADING